MLLSPLPIQFNVSCVTRQRARTVLREVLNDNLEDAMRFFTRGFLVHNELGKLLTAENFARSCVLLL